MVPNSVRSRDVGQGSERKDADMFRKLIEPDKSSSAHAVLNPPKQGHPAAGGRIPPPRSGKDWWAARPNAMRTGHSAQAARRVA